MSMFSMGHSPYSKSGFLQYAEGDSFRGEYTTNMEWKEPFASQVLSCLPLPQLGSKSTEPSAPFLGTWEMNVFLRPSGT
jgi:hypothetical protein